MVPNKANILPHPAGGLSASTSASPPLLRKSALDADTSPTMDRFTKLGTRIERKRELTPPSSVGI
ncbi:hypothetical protein M407DRAFT_245561 [Tulasnella calospora MUT 4182]|uniref:Uncharacterized protein n=1 Tax=Tulasnella calospora MUT 4182 TaxID=1051891 RepID=A0A0C3KI85_9AGAM|nr:hypothetical protein M407DRAFT_245561 [Tulasnella calospora MUT 4182]